MSAQAVRAAKAGQVQFRVEKAGIVHGGVGKASFDERLAGGEHPGVRRGRDPRQAGRGQGYLLKRVAISSTMGPGVHVEVASLAG